MRLAITCFLVLVLSAGILLSQSASQASLAMALDQLTRDRQLRNQVFFEMDRELASTARTSTEAIARSLRQAAVRETVWSSRRSIFRQVSEAAACIIIGLFVGWVAREHTSSRIPPPNNKPVTQIGDERPARGFNVAITDNRGRVLAEQRFDTLSEAQQFSNDLMRWQTRQRDMSNGNVRLIGGGF